MIGVYEIRNINNNKVYIGSSNDIQRRWNEHIRKLNNNTHHSYKLQGDWNIYGESCFIFNVLEEVKDENQLLIIEQQWLDKIKPYIDGYNVYPFADKYRLNFKEYIETEDYISIRYESFYKANVDELQEIIPDLSMAEKAFLFSIVPYISYEDCHLQYRNKKDIDIKDMIKVTGLSKNTVYSVVKSLKEKDILYQGENSSNRQWFINPWLFCRGQRLNKVLRTMFKNYKIRVLGGKKWADIQREK